VEGPGGWRVEGGGWRVEGEVRNAGGGTAFNRSVRMQVGSCSSHSTAQVSCDVRVSGRSCDI
jgi:hypothetical protein